MKENKNQIEFLEGIYKEVKDAYYEAAKESKIGKLFNYVYKEGKEYMLIFYLPGIAHQYHNLGMIDRIKAMTTYSYDTWKELYHIVTSHEFAQAVNCIIEKTCGLIDLVTNNPVVSYIFYRASEMASTPLHTLIYNAALSIIPIAAISWGSGIAGFLTDMLLQEKLISDIDINKIKDYHISSLSTHGILTYPYWDDLNTPKWKKLKEIYSKEIENNIDPENNKLLKEFSEIYRNIAWNKEGKTLTKKFRKFYEKDKDLVIEYVPKLLKEISR